jgi:hypothetical protein
VSSLSERFGLSFSLVGLSKLSAVANLVIGAAVDNNLPIYEFMERAVAQYEAVGGDHLALRREFIKLVVESAAWPPQTEPEEEFKLAHSERTETDGLKEEGPEEECELGGNPGNQQIKGMWRLTLTNMRMRSTTTKAC